MALLILRDFRNRITAHGLIGSNGNGSDVIGEAEKTWELFSGKDNLIPKTI